MSKNWADVRPEPGAAKSWRVEYPESQGSFLGDPVNDDLMTLIMELAAETWVVKRRLRLLEDRLESSGVVVPLDLEVRNEDEHAASTVERDSFVQGIFGHLLAESPASPQS